MNTNSKTHMCERTERHHGAVYILLYTCTVCCAIFRLSARMLDRPATAARKQLRFTWAFPFPSPARQLPTKPCTLGGLGRRDQGAYYDGRAPRVSAEEHRSVRDLDLCSVCGRINKLITHTPCDGLKIHAPVHKRLLSACIQSALGHSTTYAAIRLACGARISASYVSVICSRVALICACPFGNSSGWICSFVPV